MKYLYLLALGMLTANVACGYLKGSKRSFQNTGKEFLVVGHRGDAAHFPENSIEGFLSAISKGAHAIEMDVVISGDSKVVVSHEPYMAARYMLSPDGSSISKKDQLKYNLYKMPYEKIREFDSGSKYNPQFPKQQKFKTYKPLLGEVIDSVERSRHNRTLPPVYYLIEVKSQPKNYGTFQPPPTDLARLVMEELHQKNIRNQVIIKSFDPAFLNTLHELDPGIKISYLVSHGDLKRNLEKLTFTPDIYSPGYRNLKNSGMVDSIQALGMKVIPWTVNPKHRIRKMIRLGVDGVITDYPERALEIIN